MCPSISPYLHYFLKTALSTTQVRYIQGNFSVSWLSHIIDYWLLESSNRVHSKSKVQQYEFSQIFSIANLEWVLTIKHWSRRLTTGYKERMDDEDDDDDEEAYTLKVNITNSLFI